MAPKMLRASPKPTGRPVKKAKATGKPKGSSPSMILGSASKAGMQSKQGRNFLLPKTKPKKPKLKDFLPSKPSKPPNRRRKEEFKRGTPLPREVKTPDQLEKLREKLKKMGLPPKQLSGLDKLAPKMARDLKSTGRLNMVDIKRVRDRLKTRKAK